MQCLYIYTQSSHNYILPTAFPTLSMAQVYCRSREKSDNFMWDEIIGDDDE